MGGFGEYFWTNDRFLYFTVQLEEVCLEPGLYFYQDEEERAED